MEHRTQNMKENVTSFHEKLKKLMDELAHLIYDITESFPKSEQFGLISQLRRAGLSIILNFIEGYARRRKPVLKNFLEISYGSLKETKYLIYFSHKRKYITDLNYQRTLSLCEEIGKMLWGMLSNL